VTNSLKSKLKPLKVLPKKEISSLKWSLMSWVVNWMGFWLLNHIESLEKSKEPLKNINTPQIWLYSSPWNLIRFLEYVVVWLVIKNDWIAWLSSIQQLKTSSAAGKWLKCLTDSKHSNKSFGKLRHLWEGIGIPV